jgi:hypothetical protein
MAQQTAVEWLQSEWQKKDIDISIRDLWKQAKEMEKEQILNAHNHGEYNSQFMDALDDIDSIEYYNKTYTK